MKNDNLKVSLVQTNLVWENAAANRELFDKKIERISDSDLIILPEMFTTGFSMNPEKLSESMDGETVKWMKNHSATLNSSLIGSLIISENN